MRKRLIVLTVALVVAGISVFAKGSSAPPSSSARTRIETIASLAPSLPFSAPGAFPCHWAVGMCSVPQPNPSHAAGTASSGSHAKKLYRLWSSASPLWLDGKHVSPVGRVVVKDAWHAKRATPEESVAGRFPRSPSTWEDGDPCSTPFVFARDGEAYQAERKAGLFVMMKLDPATPDTDHGWIYGTVNTAGQVTTAGIVEECVACHHTAPYDHLFGP